MRIVICSAGRPEILRTQTLQTLRTANIKNIDIFVIVPYEEVPTYTKVLEEVNDLPFCIWGAPKGLAKQRQFARNLFSPEEEIVFLDDDIQRLRELQENGELKDVIDGEAMFQNCFKKLREHSAAMWGIYPMANRGWQSMKLQRDYAYCVGACYGIVNNKVPLEPEEDEGEDFARQLAILKSGGHVIRFCKYGIQTKYWRSDKEQGGIQRTKESTQRIFRDLSEAYSDIVSLVTTRTGRLNLKFKQRATLL